jgi:CelD/BcsL family acetyltransferase involved in cellulose biosynthesis
MTGSRSRPKRPVMPSDSERGDRAPTARLDCTLVPPSSFAVIDPIHDPRWAALIERSAACIFHHPAWLALLARIYRYPVVACVVLDADGELAAGVPLALVGGRVNRARLVALPFSDATAPLARCDLPSEFRRLGVALDQLRRVNGLDLELRDELLDGRTREPLVTYRRHVLSVAAGYDEVVRGMKPQVARGERRARREGLRAEFRRDAAALSEFYALHVRTRRRQGVPTQPKRFIMGFEELFQAGLGYVLLVRDGRTTAAAAVFLSYGGTLIYKYGASDHAALPKRPNNLLFMEAIRWACENGIDRLDFGRTDEHHDSLSSFKRSFGAEESTLAYTLLSDSPRHAPGHGGGAAASVIRHSPPLVGRVAGELLYRDFGA